MATKFSLVIFLNLLSISLLFSPCLAKAGGISGKANKNGNNLNMLKAAKPFIQSFIGFLNQSNSMDPNSQSNGGDLPQSSGIYTVSFAIGTPPQNVTAVMDIAAKFFWTQCQTCTECVNQSTPLYDPKLSSTYYNYSGLRCADNPGLNHSSVCQARKPDHCTKSCTYSSDYGDGKNSSGILGVETITFGSSKVSDIVIGCGFKIHGDYDNSSGVLSLGRSPYSFVNQLGYQRFSYCLSSDQTKESPLNFGSDAKLEGSGQSTRLIAVDAYPRLYYIDLVDIMVAGTPLNIPNSSFAIDEEGEGGVFLASTFPVTYLEKAAYKLVKAAFISQMNQIAVNNSDLDLDLCYNNSVNRGKWPSLTLRFAANASLELKPVNYMIKDPDTGLECLTILPVEGFSVLGSFIQMDTNFVYDIENSTISFERCNVSSAVISDIPHLVTTMVLFLFCMLKFF